MRQGNGLGIATLIAAGWAIGFAEATLLWVVVL